ncbi:MAG: 50S ribosomal protein L32 [Deltaproteobacteria bacterium]|nr:50S ribosomal protein L32 [Deltaproteobacteria bacterium]
MPVPKKRKSPARRDRRRANHDKVTMPPMTYCANPECGAPVLPHHVCPECGQYRGEAVIEVVSEEEMEAKRKARKDRAKAAKAAKAGAGAPPPAKGEKKEDKEEEDDEDEDEKK